jgi:hypothetical protein
MIYDGTLIFLFCSLLLIFGEGGCGCLLLLLLVLFGLIQLFDSIVDALVVKLVDALGSNSSSFGSVGSSPTGRTINTVMRVWRIGSRAGFRFQWKGPWRFESSGKLDDVICYLQKVKAENADKELYLDVGTEGYESLVVSCAYQRDESNEEFERRLECERIEREYREQEARKKAEREALRKEYDRLGRKLGIASHYR